MVSVARARAPAGGFKFCWSQRKEPCAFLSAFPDVGQEQKKQGLKTCQQSNINNGVRLGTADLRDAAVQSQTITIQHILIWPLICKKCDICEAQ